MIKKQTYKIFPDLELGCVYCSGETNIDDLLTLMSAYTSDPAYYPGIPLIGDFRDSQINFQEHDILKYINHLENNSNMRGNRHVAILTTTPQQTTIGIQYGMYASDMPMRINVFTTLEACMRWAGVPIEHLGRLQSFFLGQQDKR